MYLHYFTVDALFGTLFSAELPSFVCDVHGPLPAPLSADTTIIYFSFDDVVWYTVLCIHVCILIFLWLAQAAGTYNWCLGHIGYPDLVEVHLVSVGVVGDLNALILQRTQYFVFSIFQNRNLKQFLVMLVTISFYFPKFLTWKFPANHFTIT